MKRVMLTGWAGFIGSNLTRMILNEMPEWEVHAADAHTYAARPNWALDGMHPGTLEGFLRRQRFVDYPKLDLYHRDLVLRAMDEIEPDLIIHLAAESHVCRSIDGPRQFLNSNVVGTFNLLEACRVMGFKGVFHHVSTDEVFGDLGEPNQFTDLRLYDPKFTPETKYDPRSPYAASKAASDHFVQAYHHTYGLNTRMTNCSNNYGPNQHEEKLIPKTILRILRGEPVTLYGPGSQVRDWIWVEDHCRGILAAIENGKSGGQYLLGGEMERTNSNVVTDVFAALAELYVREGRQVPPLPAVVHTSDRPTDDLRYAIDTTVAKRELAWAPAPLRYRENLIETVRWYRDRVMVDA